MRSAPTVEFEKAWNEREEAYVRRSNHWKKIHVVLSEIHSRGGIATTRLVREEHSFEVKKERLDRPHLKYEIADRGNGLTHAMSVVDNDESVLEELGDQLFRLDCELMKLSVEHANADWALKKLIGIE